MVTSSKIASEAKTLTIPVLVEVFTHTDTLALRVPVPPNQDLRLVGGRSEVVYNAGGSMGGASITLKDSAGNSVITALGAGDLATQGTRGALTLGTDDGRREIRSQNSNSYHEIGVVWNSTGDSIVQLWLNYERIEPAGRRRY